MPQEKMVPDSLWFMFDGALLLLHEDSHGERSLPRSPAQPLPTGYLVQQIGEYQGAPCMALALDSPPAYKNVPGSGYVGMELHYKAHALLGTELYRLAARARELVYWDTNSQFCPVCGSKNILAAAICKKCPNCGKELFPPVSVAILAVVIRKNSAAPGGDEILLARSHMFTRNYHSLIAGFLEAGETLEACVEREVMEETALSVNNIRYFGSQPWPHPSNLMVGFAADYVSGVIKIQESELVSAGFFWRDNMPELPYEFSLSRKLINRWICGDLTGV